MLDPQQLQVILDDLREQGVTTGDLLGRGMEGAVFEVSESLVVKVWFDRKPDELRTLQSFYEAAHSVDLEFALPRILNVATAAGYTVTVEDRLPGAPLKPHVSTESVVLDERVVTCVLSVLQGLARIPATDVMKRLPVLGSETGLYESVDEPWPEAIVRLAARRSEQFGHLLERDVPDLEVRRRTLLQTVKDLSHDSSVLVHGDICPENILVDHNLKPTALVDFGFFSTAGDPVFDAAVASCITEMYGPHHLRHEQQVSEACATVIPGFDVKAPLYKALYGLITSNAYDPDGTDGHYAFCVDLIQRPDVTKLLNL